MLGHKRYTSLPFCRIAPASLDCIPHFETSPSGFSVLLLRDGRPSFMGLSLDRLTCFGTVGFKGI